MGGGGGEGGISGQGGNFGRSAKLHSYLCFRSPDNLKRPKQKF